MATEFKEIIRVQEDLIKQLENGNTLRDRMIEALKDKIGIFEKHKHRLDKLLEKFIKTRKGK